MLELLPVVTKPILRFVPDRIQKWKKLADLNGGQILNHTERKRTRWQETVSRSSVQIYFAIYSFIETYFSIYVGESKIIPTIGTRFAVGYTAGWAWQNTHALLLSYHCGAGVTLTVHFCHEFFAINMDTPNFICTKEEQRAVIHFCGLKVYQVSKCIKWCQCCMGTVSMHNVLSVNGARG